MKTFLILGSLILFLASCIGQDESPEARTTRLGGQLRCPVCRGVSIAASPSALAQEMMGLVREQVAAGKTDEEILRFFEERYGEWALLKPKPTGMNLLVWILPILFVIGGVVTIMIRTRRQNT